MKTYGYIRVSTEEQAARGLSLADQQAHLQVWEGTAYGSPLDEVLIDAGQSGKSLDRPQMQRLLTEVKQRKVAKVIVCKLDRLTRSVRDLAELVETFNARGVQLISLQEQVDTTSAMGRMFLNLMGMIAQWERETIVERTTAALSYRRKTGRVFGHIPYGWAREERQLNRDAAQQNVLTVARSLRTEGWTYQRIASSFNESSIPTPRGGKEWRAKTVWNILNSAAKMEHAV
jgi:DNA invertase Pin-like site-specific DNA recombinase